VGNPNIQRNSSFPALGEWVVAYEESCSELIRSIMSITGYCPLLDPTDLTGHTYFHDGLLGSWLGCGVVSMNYEQAPRRTEPGPAGSRAPQTWPVRDALPPSGSGQEQVGKQQFNADKKELLRLLKIPEVRNFLGHGHGAVPFIMGLAAEDEADGFMGLGLDELKRELKGHRYRFVFLNGCKTGGYDLMRAFGADTTETPYVFREDMSTPVDVTLDIGSYSGRQWPAAFVGWTDSIPYTEVVDGNVQFLRAQAFLVGQIAADWAYGTGTGPMPLRAAIDRAKADTQYLFGGNLNGLDLSKLVMYGYRNLTCTGYDHASDPRP